jgi:sortase A
MTGRHCWELTAWTLGVALGSLYVGMRLWSNHERAEGIEEFRAARAASLSTPAPQAAVPDTIDQSLWSPQRVATFAASLTSAGAPRGVLRIPSLALAVPVYEGTGELALNRGAGHIEGTAQLSAEGNIGLAAHRDGFFRPLKDIALDAEIQLDAGGELLRYRVVDISIVTPEDVHVLAPTPIPSITLVTCYPFYFVGNAPQRYIVRAELTDATPVVSGS